MLLGTMEFYAHELKTLHEGSKRALSDTRPGCDESQIASEALELALELEDSLPSDSSSEDEDRPSLDDVMTFLRRHTPPA